MTPDGEVFHGNVLPPAVRRQVDRAEQLHRELTQPGEQPGEQPAEQAPEPAAEPSDKITTVVNEGESQAPPPAPEGQASQAFQGDSQPPSRDQDASYWKQRHDTVEGKYRAETAELRGRVRGLEAHIGTLQGLLARLEQQQVAPAAPAAPAAPVARKDGEIPAEDVEAYGSELVQATRRWARAEVQQEIEQLKHQVVQLRDQGAETAQAARMNGVHAALDAAVPSWRTVNNDPAFLAWLDQADPFAGRKRQELLGDAYVRGDAARTVAFFEAFVREHTVVQSPGRPPAHTARQNGASAGSVPLAELAAPGRSGPASRGAPPEKRLWSQGDIAAFYSDVRRGKYLGREPEQTRLEHDILAAVSDGRLRN